MGILSGKNRTTIVNGAVNVVKKVVGLVDEKNFTAEEASKFNLETAQAAGQFVKDTLTESTDRAVTRRRLAIDFIRFFCLLVLILIGAWKFDPIWGEFILKIMIDLKLAWAFMAIIAFFFGAHLLRQYQPSVRKK
jgi:hypothetical protein